MLIEIYELRIQCSPVCLPTLEFWANAKFNFYLRFSTRKSLTKDIFFLNIWRVSNAHKFILLVNFHLIKKFMRLNFFFTCTEWRIYTFRIHKNIMENILLNYSCHLFMENTNNIYFIWYFSKHEHASFYLIALFFLIDFFFFMKTIVIKFLSCFLYQNVFLPSSLPLKKLTINQQNK